ncbi:hypothetical protein AB6D09_009335 [Vibrio cyclitrophicus]
MGSRIRHWQRETGLEATTYKIKNLKLAGLTALIVMY